MEKNIISPELIRELNKTPEQEFNTYRNLIISIPIVGIVSTLAYFSIKLYHEEAIDYVIGSTVAIFLFGISLVLLFFYLKGEKNHFMQKALEKKKTLFSNNIEDILKVRKDFKEKFRNNKFLDQLNTWIEKYD